MTNAIEIVFWKIIFFAPDLGYKKVIFFKGTRFESFSNKAKHIYLNYSLYLQIKFIYFTYLLHT